MEDDFFDNIPPNLNEAFDDDASLLPNWKKDIVDDPNAPELYSQYAIFGFSFFFSPIFSSVLMAMNLKRLEKLRLIVPIVLFGVICNIVAMLIMQTKLSSVWAIYIFNALISTVFAYYIWPRSIGSKLKYRRRSTLIPRIIGLTISGIIVWSIFVGK